MHFQQPADALPVANPLREQLLEQFVAAAAVALAEMAQVEVGAHAIYRTERPRALGDLSALLRLTSENGGTLIFGFPAATASAFAGRILAEVTDAPVYDLVRDCAGEIANVVVGQAKALLHDTPYRFSFSTPTVLAGPELEIEIPPDSECLVILFGSELGDFALQLCLSRASLLAMMQAPADDSVRSLAESE